MSQSWRINHKEFEYVGELLSGGFPGAQQKSFIRNLEMEFAAKFGIPYAITFTNGTATMHAILHACGIGPGDEVIVPPLTMSATTIAVLNAGATPVFADVDPATFNMSAATAEAKITPRTKAIMPVSLYGLPVALPDLMALARRHNLKVIEDSAQCFLAKVNGQYAGTIGDAGSFSFQNSKHMTCGEGGMVICHDLELANKIRRFSSLGYGMVSAVPGKSKIDKRAIAKPDTVRHTDYGCNYRLSEVTAAIALAQLEKLDQFVAMRVKCAEAYLDVTAGCEFLRPQAIPAGVTHSYWACSYALDTKRIKWQDFYDRFCANGGDGFYGAWRLTYHEPYYAAMFPEVAGSCPTAENLQPRMIQLKTHYGTAAEISTQAQALDKTVKSFR